MVGTPHTPYELGEIAFKQGHSPHTNPYKKLIGNSPRLSYNSDWGQWELGYWTARAQAAQDTRNRQSS